MHPSLLLADHERYTLLGWYRQHPDPALRLRSQIVLLLADGRAWADIAAFLYYLGMKDAHKYHRYTS